MQKLLMLLLPNLDSIYLSSPPPLPHSVAQTDVEKTGVGREKLEERQTEGMLVGWLGDILDASTQITRQTDRQTGSAAGMQVRQLDERGKCQKESRKARGMEGRRARREKVGSGNESEADSTQTDR